MKTNLTKTAELQNAKLETAGRSERWEIDTDSFSNSVGTWFCGSLGGVTDAKTMREHTDKILEAAK